MSNPATFIGVDLAWKSERNPTGAVTLRARGRGAVLVDVAPPLRSMEAAISYVRTYGTRPCIVAIDAPLVIENPSGQRACERLIGQRYGARDASCHTSNRAIYPDPASVRFADELAAMGFVHAPECGSGASAVMLEVYPHAAMVALYDLPQIIKYKKGRVSDKRAGLRRLQQMLWLLTCHDPPLLATDDLRLLLDQPVDALQGRALKEYEDSLDALMCAYIGFHFWVWEGTRTEVFGDAASGYIANPVLQVGWAQGRTRATSAQEASHA